MSVYIVESGLYDERRIWGVFTTLEEARAASIKACIHDSLYTYRSEVSVSKWDGEESQISDAPGITVYIAKWREKPGDKDHRVVNEFTTEEAVPEFDPVLEVVSEGGLGICVGTSRDAVLNAAKTWMEEN